MEKLLLENNVSPRTY
jgi:hypothetical protein